MQTLINDSRVGKLNDQKIKPLPGFKPSTPVVFCGLYPIDASDYDHLKESLNKLKLNDSSFSFYWNYIRINFRIIITIYNKLLIINEG